MKGGCKGKIWAVDAFVPTLVPLCSPDLHPEEAPVLGAVWPVPG